MAIGNMQSSVSIAASVWITSALVFKVDYPGCTVGTQKFLIHLRTHSRGHRRSMGARTSFVVIYSATVNLRRMHSRAK